MDPKSSYFDDSVILLVDDEESIRMTFQLFLNRAGYQHVLTADSISSALEQTDKKPPDLIISDIVLKGESGIDLLLQLRERGIESPVVMITGFPNLQSAADAVRLGAFDYLAKPVNKETLLSFTRQALTQYGLEKEKKQLIKENEQYRNYLEAVFRSVGEIMVTVDPEMRIIAKNETAANWLKKKTGLAHFPDDLEGLDSLFGLPCLDTARKVLESKQEVRERRVECQMQDGENRVFSFNGSPILDNDGHFYGVVLVGRDVTLPSVESPPSCRVQFHGYVGISPVMQEVFSLIENVAKFDTTVLITGESGTGKELAAEALHAESHRRNGPLVKVDCASIPENLLESELFGHCRGSFTGAETDRAGRIQQADQGTLFLDEIGDITPHTQLRLLRFLQERTIYPVGSDQPISVDARVVTATNANLREKVDQGLFRGDLYYRLRVIEIHLPPLRSRQQGIPLLARHFLKEFQKTHGHTITDFSMQAMDTLTSYSWPGNVRELKHVVERACILCQGTTIERNHLPAELTGNSPLPDVVKESVVAAAPPLPGREENGISPINGAEEILNALRQCGGNKSLAAKLLGIDRSTLYRRMRKFNIAANRVDLR